MANEILVDKNLEIVREGTFNVMLGHSVTYLFHPDLISENLGGQYRYSLKDPQVANTNAIDLEEMEGLREYQKYIKNNQIPHKYV